MFDIAREILRELDAGRAVGVVVVTGVFGSAPRAVGSAMAVTADGRAIGSISGGCVEAEAYELARAALATGERVVTRLGGPDDPFAAGLSCGGTLAVVAFRVADAEEGLAHALRASVADGAAELAIDLGEGGVFRLVKAAAPRLVIVGAVDFSGALADAARLLGYRVTVVDPRPVFATAERFRSAHEVVVAWPDAYLREVEQGDRPLEPRDAVAVLTHQERLDVPALTVALASDAGYVGAMGSRGTHERRLAALSEAGIAADALARLRSPIGLDLGGTTPAETAVAIVAEMIAMRAQASGRPLAFTDGPIHRAPPSVPMPAASRHTLSRDIGNS